MVAILLELIPMKHNSYENSNWFFFFCKNWQADVKIHTLLLANRGRMIFSLPGTAQPMRHCHNSANEKSLNFKLPGSSSVFFFYYSPSQLPLLLYKSSLSSTLPDLHVVHHNCMSWVAVLYCYQINLFYWLKTKPNCFRLTNSRQKLCMLKWLGCNVPIFLIYF